MSSGALLDQYDYWAALNALNLYYVNSHFIHPDDVLDEDRGAPLDGNRHENLGNYMDWLYTSAPNLAQPHRQRSLLRDRTATTSCRWNAHPRRRGSICGSPASGMRPI